MSENKDRKNIIIWVMAVIIVALIVVIVLLINNKQPVINSGEKDKEIVLEEKNKDDKLYSDLLEIFNVYLPEYNPFAKLKKGQTYTEKDFEDNIKNYYAVNYADVFCNGCAHEETDELDIYHAEDINNYYKKLFGKPMNKEAGIYNICSADGYEYKVADDNFVINIMHIGCGGPGPFVEYGITSVKANSENIIINVAMMEEEYIDSGVNGDSTLIYVNPETGERINEIPAQDMGENIPDLDLSQYWDYANNYEFTFKIVDGGYQFVSVKRVK